MTTLFAILIGIILFLCLVKVFMCCIVYDDYDDEFVTTTVTTTVNVDYIGYLPIRYSPNGQPYVRDPADNSQWFLNTNDDMYEDADGNIWKLKK